MSSNFLLELRYFVLATEHPRLGLHGSNFYRLLKVYPWGEVLQTSHVLHKLQIESFGAHIYIVQLT